MDANNVRLNELSRLVIGCAFTVLNMHGHGYFESIYENALVLELQAAGLRVEQQFAMQVRHRDTVIGRFFGDILVEDTLLVEMKAIVVLADIHRMQCVNYLKASGLRLCLLLNFGNPRLEIKRVANGM